MQKPKNMFCALLDSKTTPEPPSIGGVSHQSPAQSSPPIVSLHILENHRPAASNPPYCNMAKAPVETFPLEEGSLPLPGLPLRHRAPKVTTPHHQCMHVHLC
ncbi:hypothetical protein AMECASPLE_026673 [Ameca splendens]|uniref:Uncharacterized protein n=1 Tax=Ameca splendens TaxID=208324 RepID=A0ABV0YRZ1_9TELE